MTNKKITIEYDGTGYCGWQVQLNGSSIQAALEEAISTFFGATTRITGSGRTDAGVHAIGQVASFFIDRDKNYDLHRILRGLNALTPPDITVKQIETVADAFDARRDARSRVYEYHLLNRSTASPFYRNRAWHVHDHLDAEAMQAAVRCLVGEHDFSSFRAAGCEAAHPIRRVYQAGWEKRDELLVFTIEATAFLRHMVRNIVGTVVEVGRGLRAVDSVRELLSIRDRTKAGPTAPPHGLYLIEVKYEPAQPGDKLTQSADSHITDDKTRCASLRRTQ
jgi:tRNA pseudouridine38-40 synthase